MSNEDEGTVKNQNKEILKDGEITDFSTFSARLEDA
jgi:hypothetical protein